MERTVLRVRRKRSGAEPAGTLLVACKRLRAESAASPVEKSLFRLVGTVPSKNEPVQKYVQEAAARDRAVQNLRPSAGSAHRIIQRLRSSAQAKSKENRYRVVANHRPNCTETAAAPATSAEASTDSGRSDSKATENASQRERGAVGDSWDRQESFQLFDIEQEEEVAEDSKALTASPQRADKDVILCNTVEMIRERLNVSEDGKKNCEKEAEYVYDIYCMETPTPSWIENILSVQSYTDEYELVDDDDVPEEVYEDEDDENDESNWRNDYPDEDELDEDKESGESSSDEDQPCRRRTWYKYQPEFLQEFEYDEMEDFDFNSPF